MSTPCMLVKRGLKVASQSGAIAQWKGISRPSPKREPWVKAGNKTPLFRFTVGSGVEKYGIYAIGTPKNSSCAFSKYSIFSVWSWMMRAPLTCHKGGFFGSYLQGAQAV